ncbi:MAG TPA: acetyl-CoA carboxylase biotin carboxyl carrier protein [Treponemataceae bacterium]|nr:acetyl-CoA carboxylase biotin carboxyl carrier protein [Treponemataceae bacterium]HPS43310.1 acetyl-CoA carboxylase biotin carboxyl carrier protein [Treponemataceae bacterium]
MDEKTLLSLFDKFEKSSAVEMKYSESGASFELRRKEAFASASPVMAAQAPAPAQAPSVSVSAHEPPHTASPAPHAAAAASGNEYIKSPIVGTFYRAASPDAPPFSEVGKKVTKGQKICIIEAMKMMNALEAEFDCEIVKLLVNNGDMVEFDQPIFEVKPL